jgi:hypothetical protein
MSRELGVLHRRLGNRCEGGLRPERRVEQRHLVRNSDQRFQIDLSGKRVIRALEANLGLRSYASGDASSDAYGIGPGLNASKLVPLDLASRSAWKFRKEYDLVRNLVWRKLQFES